MIKKSIGFLITLILLSTIIPVQAENQNIESHFIYLPVLFNDFVVPVSLQTKISNIDEFLEKCPTSDPMYEKFKADFIVRVDGEIVDEIACTEPISEMPIEEFTNALITYQAFRTAYYMDPGIPNHLPWTEKSLYDWLASSVGGVNLKSAPGQLYCCDYIDGRLYIAQSLQDDFQRNFKRSWTGISNTLDFFAHEARHANEDDPGHTWGCEAFPDPDGPWGCDHSYDLNNLGAYGIQYWLNHSWLMGYLNIGMSCNPETAENYVNWHLSYVNISRRRFVTNVPEVAVKPNPPYGGPCFD